MLSRVCKECGIDKPLDQLKADPTCLFGRRAHCLECYRMAQKKRHNKLKGDKNYHLRLTTIRRKHDIKRKYGITPEAYDLMANFQRHLCAICGEKDKNKRLAIDHCHNSKKVRGLLCFSCNSGIGKFRHDPAILQSAIAYLLKNK